MMTFGTGRICVCGTPLAQITILPHGVPLVPLLPAALPSISSRCFNHDCEECPGAGAVFWLLFFRARPFGKMEMEMKKKNREEFGNRP
jgi:hypothetical protein